MKIRFALLLIVLFSTLGATSAPAAQTCNLDAWRRDAGYKLTDFMDTVTVALATPRASLAPIVVQVYRDYRAFERADHPACIETYSTGVLDGMNEVARGFIMYLGDEPGSHSAVDRGLTTIEENVNAIADRFRTGR